MKHWKYYLGSAALLISFCLNFHYAYKGYGISGNGSFSRMHAAIGDDSDSFPLPDDSDTAESCDNDETDENGHKKPCFARLKMQPTLMLCTIFYFEARDERDFVVAYEESFSQDIWSNLYSFPDVYYDKKHNEHRYSKRAGYFVGNAKVTEGVCLVDGAKESCTPIKAECKDGEIVS